MVGAHTYANLHEYLTHEHPEWVPFPRKEYNLIADSVLKAAWVNCKAPLLAKYDMVDCTPEEWVKAYLEPDRALPANFFERCPLYPLKLDHRVIGRHGAS